MLGLLSRARRKSPPARPLRFRPMLEALEDRYCPSTITLTETVGNNSMVTFTGQVTNTPSPGGLTVQLSGIANGGAVTDANGNFSDTLQGTGPGQESAKTTDGLSNVATVMVQMEAITDFGYTVTGPGMYIFSGHVAGGVEGQVVNLGGIKDLTGKTAVVDSNGDFSIAVQLDALPDDNGTAWAQLTYSGVTTNEATTWVTQTIMIRPGSGGSSGTP